MARIIRQDPSRTQPGTQLSVSVSTIPYACLRSSPLFDSIPNHTDALRTMDDIRLRLLDEFNVEANRIEAVLTLTQGIPLIKQYDLAKSFLHQVQQEQALIPNHTFTNGSFIDELD